MIIIWGSCFRKREGDRGRFKCPTCGDACEFVVVQTHQYFHLYYIPLWHEKLVSELVYCQRCRGAFPITVLAADAPPIVSPLDANRLPDGRERTPLGNIVQLTPGAAAEIRRRHAVGRFTANAVVRVSLPASRETGYDLKFDYAECDCGDWIGQSQGIPIVVHQREAPMLVGKTIAYRDGRFCDES